MPRHVEHFGVTQIYTVEQGVCKFLLVFHCNYTPTCTVSEMFNVE